MTEEQIERIAAQAIVGLERVLKAGRIDQREYDRQVREWNEWSRTMLAQQGAGERVA